MKKWWKRYRFFALAVCTIAVVAAVYGYVEYNRGLPDTHHLRADFKLEASDLVGKFEINEPQANAVYVDKTISVHGLVSGIQITDTSAAVFLSDGSSVTSVMCQFENASSREIKNLKKGTQATIKGICSGYLMDVVMVRCVLDK